MIEILANTNKNNCSACGACINACPVKAISLSQDEFGFDYPIINSDLCIKCKKCENICQSYLNSELQTPLKAFAAVHKKREIAQASSSGGVFSALAEYVLSNSGAVCGCVYDKNLMPIHICSEQINDVIQMRKSKYVQSDVGYVYQDILKRLRSGQLVLFTGTPCQVAGLYTIVGNKFSNLITVDLICHGVPSRYLFSKFLEYLENKYKTKIVSFDFRSKKYGWQRYTAEFKDAHDKIHNIGKANEFYQIAYSTGNIQRPNCFNCQFATSKRIGNVTMGDFWGYSASSIKINIKNGISIFTINTPSYLYLQDVLSKQLQMEEIDYSIAINGNTGLRTPTKKGKKWDIYTQAVKENKIMSLAKQYRAKNKIRIIRGFLKLHAPMFVINLLNKQKTKKHCKK